MRLDKKQLFIALLAAFMSGSPPALAAKDPAQTLVDQARLWEGRNRPDLARLAWEKLLKAYPNHPEGLAALALLEAHSGQKAKAEAYLARLKTAKPGHPGIARAQDALRAGTVAAEQIETARKLAGAGKTEEAARQYKSVFKEEAPSGDLGLEYYQTVGGTPEGWEEARAGLDKLVRENPGDPRYQLALAQHLTYRESSRRQGIRMLADLARRPEFAAQAVDAWRKGLTWLYARKYDIPLYQRFLQAHPGDTAIKARLERLTKPTGSAASGRSYVDPLVIAKRAGFDAIESGAIQDAEETFQRVLAINPDDADALGGLGVVFLRQERFAEARDLLARARDLKPATRDKWTEAYSAASFWALAREADAARRAGDNTTAEQALVQALRLKPEETAAQLMLADILAERQEFARAGQYYDRVLAREPGNTDALRGRINLLIQLGRGREALATLDSLSDEQRDAVGVFGGFRANLLRAEAEELEKLGRTQEAVARLEDALLMDPENVWTRLDLARLYAKHRLGGQARGLVDSALALDAGNPSALYAAALFQSEQGDAWQAVHTLEQIPPQARTAPMTALQRRMWVKVQGQRAIAYGQAGYARETRDIIARAEAAAGQDPELVGDIAMAYAELGDHGRALALMRKALSRQTTPSVGLRMQYAAVLLKTRQDAELALVLRQLGQQPDLTEQEWRDYGDLYVAYCLRTADALREAGDLATAYDTLAPALELRPEDPLLLLALARMYVAAGEPAEAIRIYQRVLAQETDNLDARMALIGALMDLRDYDNARREVNIALRQAPDNPRVLTVAGKIAKARGEPASAVDYFRRALAAERTPAGPGRFVADLRMVDAVRPQAEAAATPAARGNPFAGRAGLRPTVPPAPQSGPVWTPTWQTPASHPLGQTAGSGYYSPPGSAGYASPYPVQTPPAAAYLPPASPTAYYGQPASTIPVPPPAPAYIPPAATYTPPPAPTYAPPPARTYTPPPAPAYTPPPAPTYTPPPAPTYTPPPAPAYTPPPAPTYTPPPADTSYFAPVPRPAPYVPPPAPATPPAAPRPVEPYTPPQAAPYEPRAYPAAPAGRLDPYLSSQPRDPSPAEEIMDIESRHTASVTMGAGYQVRTGDSGLSKLQTFEPLLSEVRIPVAYNGHLFLRLDTTLLDAGPLNLADRNATSRFGRGLSAVRVMPKGTPLVYAGKTVLISGEDDQSDAGGAAAIGYESEHVRVDIGSTPIGFQENTMVGGLKLDAKWGNFGATLDLSRRPVTDSLLSYAGTQDSNTGEEWGGVLATGGRLWLDYDAGQMGVYGTLAFHGYTGHNVKDNYRYEMGGGAYWKFVDQPDMRLTAGINLTAIGFDENLRYYTYGHGGYFSPQSYFSLAVPMELSGRQGRLAYQLSGSIGVQSFEEDAAPYFPTDPAYQALWEDWLDSGWLPTGAAAYYPGQSKTGLGFTLTGGAEYQVTDRFYLGGRLSFDNARDYTLASGLVYLRYNFAPSLGPIAFPPQAITPYAHISDRP